MNILESITSLAGNTPWGAVIGGVFGIGKQWLDNRQQINLRSIMLKEKETDHAHDLDMVDKEIERASRQASFTLAEKDLEVLSASNLSQDSETSALSIALSRSGNLINGFASVVFVIITAIQKTIRPAITVASFILMWQIYLKTNEIIGGFAALPSEEILLIFKLVVKSALDLTMAYGMYWCVSRPPKRTESYPE